MSQEFETNILDLVMQKRFYRYEFMSSFEIFKAELRLKEKFYSALTSRKISDKEYEHVLKVWNTFQMKVMEECH